MSPISSSARKRLIHAALDLFSSQGFNATTTRQIADLAQVNEATLFRNFGSKHDLLLAVIEDARIFTQLQDALQAPLAEATSLADAIRYYSRDRLHTLEYFSELLRALVGEAAYFSLEQRRTFGQRLMQSTADVARYLTTFIEQEQLDLIVSPEQFAGLLNSILFGYLITELTSEVDDLWASRDGFLDQMVTLFLYGAVSSPPTTAPAIKGLQHGSEPSHPPAGSLPETPIPQATAQPLMDLPTDTVRSILQQAKKQGPQPYAIAFLLFGAGLQSKEVVNLERSHHICNSRQHLVQINQGAVRQVPVNQWIMGKRYGSYSNNPLSQWLKGRKDEASALFINDQEEPLSIGELLDIWNTITAEVQWPISHPPTIEQTRQTWCIDMLMKGISPADLSILSGWTAPQLQPYVRRAREKEALERAIQLDQK